MDQIQYRASGMIWMIGAVLEPLIYLVVWSTVAEARGGEVGGFTSQQFAAYYITLMMVNHLTFTWIMQVFQFCSYSWSAKIPINAFPISQW